MKGSYLIHYKYALRSNDRLGIKQMPSHSVGNVRANGILSYAADASYRQNAANRLLKRSL